MPAHLQRFASSRLRFRINTETSMANPSSTAPETATKGPGGKALSPPRSIKQSIGPQVFAVADDLRLACCAIEMMSMSASVLISRALEQRSSAIARQSDAESLHQNTSRHLLRMPHLGMDISARKSPDEWRETMDRMTDKVLSYAIGRASGVCYSRKSAICGVPFKEFRTTRLRIRVSSSNGFCAGSPSHVIETCLQPYSKAQPRNMLHSSFSAAWIRAQDIAIDSTGMPGSRNGRLA